VSQTRRTQSNAEFAGTKIHNI